MDVDLDRPTEDDTMEYEVEDGTEPSAGLHIDGDETLEEVLRDDEVMGIDPILPNDGAGSGGAMPIDGDPEDVVVAEADEGDEADNEVEGGGMEPEPTPIPSAVERNDPFFPDPKQTVVKGDEMAGTGERREAPLSKLVASGKEKEAADGALDRGGGTTDVNAATDHPFSGGSPSANVNVNINTTQPDLDASISDLPPNASTSASAAQPASGTQDRSTIVGEEKEGEEYAEEDGEEEYYEEDAEAAADTVEGGEGGSALEDDGQGSSGLKAEHGALASGSASISRGEVGTSAPPGKDSSTSNGNEDNPVTEEQAIEADEETYDNDLDEMLTVHTLPDIILHLPDQPPKSLFFPLNADERLPDGISASTPVWFEDRHEELAQVSLAELCVAIRGQVQMGGKSKREGKEMILEERGLGLKLGEHDKYLSEVNLLEYVQVHHSCELPTPIQFFITFQTSRFWDRFDAIRKELVVQAERRNSVAAEQGDVGVDDAEGEEEGEGGMESEIPDEGYASGDDVEDGGEEEGEAEDHGEEEVNEAGGSGERSVVTNTEGADQRRPKDNDAQARYGGSENDDASRTIRNEPETAHPQADWASKLPTSPMAYGVGTRGSANLHPSQQVASAPSGNDVPPSGEKKGVDSINNQEAKAGDAVIADKPNTSSQAETPTLVTTARMEMDDYNVPLGDVELLQAKQELEARQQAEREKYGLAPDSFSGIGGGDSVTATEATTDVSDRAIDGDIFSPGLTEGTKAVLAAHVPLGDRELLDLETSSSAPIVTPDASLASDTTSGLLTPPLGSTSNQSSSVPEVGSSLAREVHPDETDTYPSTIDEEDEDEGDGVVDEAEGDEATYEEEEEEYEEEEEEAAEGEYDVDEMIKTYDDKEEKAGTPDASDLKEPIVMAVEDGLISEKAAINEVGEEAWDEMNEQGNEYIVEHEDSETHEIPSNPYVADSANGKSPTLSNTAQEVNGNDDYEEGEGEMEDGEDVDEIDFLPRSAKRSAEDDGDTVSKKAKASPV